MEKMFTRSLSDTTKLDIGATRKPCIEKRPTPSPSIQFSFWESNGLRPRIQTRPCDVEKGRLW